MEEDTKERHLQHGTMEENPNQRLPKQLQALAEAILPEQQAFRRTMSMGDTGRVNGPPTKPKPEWKPIKKTVSMLDIKILETEPPPTKAKSKWQSIHRTLSMVDINEVKKELLPATAKPELPLINRTVPKVNMDKVKKVPPPTKQKPRKIQPLHLQSSLVQTNSRENTSVKKSTSQAQMVNEGNNAEKSQLSAMENQGDNQMQLERAENAPFQRQFQMFLKSDEKNSFVQLLENTIQNQQDQVEVTDTKADLVRVEQEHSQVRQFWLIFKSSL
ncbi:uncharacterized protein LOC130645161 isoform X1 [Hydractinia symbiolongicarpus]|uniref:uncharacterized protein LOC130645161 isoform X1 n=1 Tax=Hydractinia symbiolongicarpus TaxID=13093 RepID=UPI00254C9D65|nr:uncharacterized protein LOC130645161 isoform X1 [Hydractinia symbiolongicarpus]XP_057307037.1 uncharacterized protein LOC130645161 isoform X1 [Hydractinia symbiolongicarpus]